MAAGDEEVGIEFDGGDAAPGWNRLGTFTLDAGVARVVVSNRSSGETVIADAIRWLRVGPRDSAGISSQTTPRSRVAASRNRPLAAVLLQRVRKFQDDAVRNRALR